MLGKPKVKAKKCNGVTKNLTSMTIMLSLKCLCRATKNLTTPSIFSQKYGLLSKEEAEEDANRIEKMKFNMANQPFEKKPYGNGSSTVQIYAKESSKLMLEVLKRGLSVKEDGELVDGKVSVTSEIVFDISRGRRAFIDREEAAELLKPQIGPNSYTKICFSNRVLACKLLVLLNTSYHQSSIS